MGQTAHLAARMEQLAAPGTILPDRRHAARWPRATSQVQPLGPVPVKGLDEPVEVFELLGGGPGADAASGGGRARA